MSEYTDVHVIEKKAVTDLENKHNLEMAERTMQVLELEEKLKIAVEAIEMQHKEWGLNSADCTPECTDLCKALAKIEGEK
jgi:hypothetical protein